MSEIILSNPTPTPIGGSGKILSLEEYAARRELSEVSVERDEAITAALASAEDAVLQYTGRDFTQPAAAETRTYLYEGTGILEVDDFINLTSIVAADATLPTSGYVPGPREGATYYWIDFAGVPRQSPQMGFTRNLDTIFARQQSHGRNYVNVDVTAEFGWPGAAPEGIKQAVTWMVDEFRKSEGSQGDIQAEGIADLNYVYQRISESATMPARVLALLDPYRRVAL